MNCFKKTREQACNLINEKFLKNNDKKIKIKINNDVLDEIKKLIDNKDDDESNSDKGGENDGEIYDNN